MDSNQPSDIGFQPPVPGVDSNATDSTPPAARASATDELSQAMIQTVHEHRAVSSDDGSEELDQEWVSKAKDIVEKTKSDPFLQSQELSRVKAGYLKVRYNKDFKVGEDSA